MPSWGAITYGAALSAIPATLLAWPSPNTHQRSWWPSPPKPSLNPWREMRFCAQTQPTHPTQPHA
jgi:hypothetical protein